MKNDPQAIEESGKGPVVVHPGPLSIDELLRFVVRAPDDETERFVAAIYADRRESSHSPE